MLNLKAGLPKNRNGFVLAALALVLCLAAPTGRSDDVDRKYEPSPYVKITHPEWSRDAVIYQLNTRQFTPEGTFAAAAKHLPRLKELGIESFTQAYEIQRNEISKKKRVKLQRDTGLPFVSD